MLEGVYIKTLGKDGKILSRTRIRYSCSECGILMHTIWGNYINNSGMCKSCNMRSK